MRLQGFNTSNLAFATDTPDTTAGHQLVVDAPAAIEVGQTQILHLTLRDAVWAAERLIEVNNPRLEVAGQLVFQDSSGARSHATVGSSVIPKLF
jgi:hypothetical protein